MKRAVYIVTAMNAGGAETVLMKFYRAIDRTKYQIDFCVSSDQEGFYDVEILSMGGNIIHTVKKSSNPIKSFFRLKEIAKEGNYCAAIRTSQNSLSAIDLLAMRCGGVEKLVFRSSNTGSVQGGLLEAVVHRLFKPLARAVPSQCVAPSLAAGRYMFGDNCEHNKKFMLLHNAIDYETYKYSDEKRGHFRRELAIAENTFVVGHVGRFNQQKNHRYLIDVFKEVHSQRNDSCLLLFGAGELEQNIKTYVDECGLNGTVVFAGIKSNINDYYSVMDAFVFPSLYEGLPNVIVEAQCNGLPCLISDSITEEVCISNNINRLSFCKGADHWAKLVLQSTRGNVSAIKDFSSSPYNINNEVTVFEKMIFG